MGLNVHTDEQKKFDVRNIDRGIKSGIITQKDYETYLSKLPDVNDKVFNPEEPLDDSRPAAKTEGESSLKKKESRKKVKGKGK